MAACQRQKAFGQLPLPGSEVANGSCVLLYAGQGPEQTQVEVPDVSAMTLSEARELLEPMGLFLDTSGTTPMSENAVISVQSIPAGSAVAYGSVVQVTLIDPGIQGEY